MQNEIMEKVKAAKSPDEILKIMRDNGCEDFTEESANKYFEFVNKTGELSDDEIEQAVGGCTVNGKTIVTNQKKCHNGQFLTIYDRIENDCLEIREDMNWNYPTLRTLWSNTAMCAGFAYIFSLRAPARDIAR